jgi:molybdenum cofactor guanylyltransferase
MNGAKDNAAKNITVQDIHAVILAGGEGRRMGGADKGLALFLGTPLAQRAAQRIAPFVDAVSVNANRNAAAYAALGYTVFSDGLPAHEGPLGGVLAALRACSAPYLLVLPCDVPNFPLDLVARLAAALQGSNAGARVAMPLATQADGSPFVEPVFMLLDCAVLPDLEAYFAAGGRKITTWAGKAGLALAPFTQPHDAAAFADADTFAALAALAAQNTASERVQHKANPLN